LTRAKVGKVPRVFHRPIPKGLKVKMGTVIAETEVGHISLTPEAQTVPVTVAEIQPTAENSLGIELGITNYAYLSNGEQVEKPRFLRQYCQKLARRPSKLASRVKGSKPGKTLKGKIYKLAQFVARTRWDFQFKTPHKLFDKCDVWVVEDLSLKKRSKRAPVKTDIEDGNLVDLPKGQAAKSGLNKSILDAASGSIYYGAQICGWEMR
jgi:putative transposase